MQRKIRQNSLDRIDSRTNLSNDTYSHNQGGNAPLEQAATREGESQQVVIWHKKR